MAAAKDADLVPVCLPSSRSAVFKWKVAFGSDVRKGDVLAELKDAAPNDDAAASHAHGNVVLKSPTDGLLRENKERNDDSCVAWIEPCSHPGTFGGLCVVCGSTVAAALAPNLDDHFDRPQKQEPNSDLPKEVLKLSATNDEACELEEWRKSQACKVFEREKRKFYSEFEGHGPHREKMDMKSGVYLPWEGSTIIMNMLDYRAAKSLYNRLAADARVTECISLLPWESYHVTLRGLFNRIGFRSKEDHKSYIDKYFSTLVNLDNQFQNETADFRFGVVHSSGKVCSIRLRCEEEKLLRTLEERVTKAIPDLPDCGKYRQCWHLTLGYGKHRPSNIWGVTASAVAHHVRQWERDRLRESFGFIHCGPPRVCWFKDMKQFYPIEGLFEPATKETDELKV